MSQKAKSTPRLGRGLSSLISVAELPVEAEVVRPTVLQPVASAGVTPQEIAVASITPNPHQPRRQWDEGSLGSLAASIKSTGLVQPVIVRKVQDSPAQYQLVAGERRWRAAQVAGLQAIPAIVREVDAYAQAQMALIENIQREDLNPVDRAQAYRALMDQLGLTQAELALRLGEERSTIANYLRILELPPAVQDLVRGGGVTLGHAKLLAGMTDPARQEELARLVATEGLSVRNLERMVEFASPNPKVAPPPAPAQSAHIKDLEKTITSALGMRVQVRAGGQKGKGRLVIHYANLDQFDALLERLGVRPE
jgi:ParB family chromosome partitioning protein